MVKTNEELETLTEAIKIEGDISTQVIKLGEKMGEVFEAEVIEKVEDGIGEMIVVLSKIANLNGSSISECQALNCEESILDKYSGHNRLLLLPVVYGKLATAVINDVDVNSIIRDTMIILDTFASVAGTTINACWNKAVSDES